MDQRLVHLRNVSEDLRHQAESALRGILKLRALHDLHMLYVLRVLRLRDRRWKNEASQSAQSKVHTCGEQNKRKVLVFDWIVKL